MLPNQLRPETVSPAGQYSPQANVGRASGPFDKLPNTSRYDCDSDSSYSAEFARKKSISGLDVLFCPPQACKTQETLDFYPAKIVAINPPSKDHGQIETMELVTFGPNSIYFQHNVPYSSQLKPGHWSHR